MANPRQRRKSRSSSHKPVSQSRRAKKNLKKMPPIRGPKVLQDAWNKHKTVRQNYIAMGLAHTLNPHASGGSEAAPPSKLLGSKTNQASPSHVPRATIPQGHGKIVRNGNGDVVSIEINEDQPRDLYAESSLELESELAGDGFCESDITEALEKISCSPTSTTTLAIPNSGAGPRYASSGEISYLQRLVSRYGTSDIQGMSRDRKLNFEQRTEGQLRRALKRSGLVDGFGGLITGSPKCDEKTHVI